MRIAIDARMANWGSVGRYTTGLLKGIAEVDQDNEYVLLAAAESAHMLPPAPNFTIVRAERPVLSLGGYREAGRLASAAGADVFHALHYPVPLGFSGGIVTTIHDLIPLDYPVAMPSIRKRLVYRLVMGQAVKRSAKLIAVSKYTAGRVTAYYQRGAAKVEVVYEGVDSRFFADPVRPRQPYMLSMGNQKPHKNLLALVKAYGRLAGASGWNLKLLLVGSPDREHPAVLDELRVLGLRDKITFSGNLSDGELVHLYQGASVFVFPSLCEGFGFPPLEAMAAGAPVVCSNRGSLPEVCGEAALLVEPDSSSLAAAVTRVLSDEELRSGFVRKGREQARKFSWAETARKTVELYESLGRQRLGD